MAGPLKAKYLEFFVWCSRQSNKGCVHAFVSDQNLTLILTVQTWKNENIVDIMVVQWKESTGKSFSGVLILASTNPQYDKRLFIELRVQYIKIEISEHAQKNCEND